MRLSLFATLSCLAFSHAGHYKDTYDLWSFNLEPDGLGDWMSAMEDTVYLSQLVIPGTHNSMTDMIDDSRFQTQNLPLSHQLRGGIRYIDISCRCINNRMKVYHGIADTGYSLDDVLTTIYDFLDEHSRETIILRIQKGGMLDSSKSFLGCIEKYFVPGTELGDQADRYIYIRNSDDDSIPSLGYARGKVLILQDFKSSPPGRYGIPWDSRSISSYNHRLTLGTLFLDSKWDGIKANLNRPPPRNLNQLRITYTTASAGVSPINIAAKERGKYGMNRRLGRYFMYEEGYYHGIIVMDFPGSFLIEHILRANNGYRMPIRDDDHTGQPGPPRPDELDLDDDEVPPGESSDDESSDDEARDDEAGEDRRAAVMVR